MFATLALSLLAPIAGVADDTTPISSAMVEIVLADQATAGPVCDSYRGIIGIIGGMGLDAAGQATFVEVVDAYAVISLEGDALRLDNGARDTLTDWLHTSCS